MKPILIVLSFLCPLISVLTQGAPKPLVEVPSKLQAEAFAKMLGQLHEPQLSELANDVNAEIYRVLIFPTWGNSISVRVQRQGDLYSLSARRLDGQAGYDAGKLVESKDIDLNAEGSKALEVLIKNLNFFQFPVEDKVQGFDGDEWMIEGVSQGKYHIAERWCANDYNPTKRGLRPFLALCKFLIDKSTLSQRPSNKGHKLI